MSYKRFFFILILLKTPQVFSQVNYYEKGHKALYWGISIGANTSNFNVHRAPLTSANDSITDVYSTSGPGFNLGLIGNWQFNKYFDLRIVPSMVFGEKNIVYKTENMEITRNINTTYITFPLLLRVKSEAINDLRLFVIGGVKYDLNISPQVRPKNDVDRIPLLKSGLSLEYGIGIQYFFPYFIFSPEIKFSHSIKNMLSPDQSPLNGSTLNGLFPRSFTISLNFEG